MSLKFLILAGLTAGSIIGGYVPTFFGVDMFSYFSVFTSGVGAILGIYIGYKLSRS